MTEKIDNLKVGFLGFDQWQGKFGIGSSRIRADWLIKHWPNSERFQQGKKYDVVVFQKAYWIEYAKKFTGIKILDMCDPDWLEPGSRVIEMIKEVDAITTSTAELAKTIATFTDKPVWYIPDRMDFEYHTPQKNHDGVGKAKSVVWFGYSHNFPALDQAIKALCDLKLDLIVIANNPYHPPAAFLNKIDITNYVWSENTVNRDIIRGDIVINPRLPYGRFKYKSNNKTLSAWALGMPVANDDQELKKFMDENERKLEVLNRRKELEEKWDVKQSVAQYKQLIEFLLNKIP